MSLTIQADHKLYIRAAKREALSWGRAIVHSQRQRRPRDHPLLKEYLARLISGEENEKDWLNWFVRKVEPFESALSLGSGTGIVEEKLLRAGLFKRLEVVDISGDAVEIFQKRLRQRGVGIAVSSRIADLNFLELPKQRYDFILAHTSLHHLVNLEHVLEQIRRALVPDGLFLVYDFIGPSGWQWSFETIEEVNRILALSQGRHPELTFHTVKRPDHRKVKEFSPFESVRSDEILGLIRAGFEPELEVVTDRLLHLLVNFGVEMEKWDNPTLQVWLKEMIDWEDSLKSGCELPPYTLWGIYHPLSSPIPAAEPWSEEEIRERIGIPRFSLKSSVSGLIDHLPARDRFAIAWMRMKRRHGWY